MACSTFYNSTQYLLDRANIQDVIKLLYMHFDLGQYERLKAEVFAEEVMVDFTVLNGGKPHAIKGIGLADQWKEGLQPKAAAAQHTVSSVVAELPQPGFGPPPSTSKAVANCSTLIKSYRNNVVQNTGRLYVDLVKLAQVKGNPWRIAAMRTEMVWQNDTPLNQLDSDWQRFQAALTPEPNIKWESEND